MVNTQFEDDTGSFFSMGTEVVQWWKTVDLMRSKEVRIDYQPRFVIFRELVVGIMSVDRISPEIRGSVRAILTA